MTPFPDFLPVDCPPADASPASGEFFRIVKAHPIKRDMDSHFEKNQPFSDDDLCEFCGISLFDSYDIMRSLLIARSKGLAKNLAKNRIASIKIASIHGVVKKTRGPNHWTWWPYSGLDRLNTIGSLTEVKI